MISQEQIQLKQARDFGETFNVSVKFIRQNFASYMGCILLLAGPFVLLYSISYSYHQSLIEYKTALIKAGQLYSMSQYGWDYFLALFMQGVSSMALTCTSYAYMVVYSEKGYNNFGPADVMKKMNSVIGKLIGAFFLYGFLATIFIGAIIFVTVMLIQSAPIVGILLVIGLFFGTLILAPNIMWQLSNSFLVIISEEEIPVSAFGRTREVMKDNFWWTWLVVICSSLIVLFIALLFMLPELIYLLMAEFSTGDVPTETSMLYMVIGTVCTFLGTMVYSMNNVIFGFHFFSLAEKKDGLGLMQRINEIGKTDQP